MRTSYRDTRHSASEFGGLPDAEADLFALCRYVAEASSGTRAEASIARIEKACMALAMFPDREAMREDIAPGIRTIGFERRATIAFRVLDHVYENKLAVFS
jgi:toxin ParE1/3/4